MLTILDKYIIKKFLGAYFMSIILIISIAVVFDFSEKLDDFIENDAPAKAIAFDYYLNFIPYYTNLFSALFVFISCIFFTSKLASNSEIIAMLAGGVSFRRIMRPYLISAIFIGLLNFVLGGFIIPKSNKIRLDFEDQYIKKIYRDYSSNIQLKVSKNDIVYIDRYQMSSNQGSNFSLDHFEGKKLVSRITAGYITYDTLDQWTVRNYMIREFEGLNEKLTNGTGKTMTMTINMTPSDFYIVQGESQLMNTIELKRYLNKQKKRGIANIKEFELQYYRHFANPFAAIILTIIALCLSSKKVRGGMGLNLGIGLMLSFSYIMFDSVSSTLTINGGFPSVISIWVPNFIFIIIAFIIYQKSPK